MAKRRHAAMARFERRRDRRRRRDHHRARTSSALAWIQSRLVFFIAAAYGFDPRDPMRPAELLVLRDLYADPQTARRALDGIGQDGRRGVHRPRSSAAATRRSPAAARSSSASARRAAAGRLIPGIAMAFNAVGNERDTRALADKAIAFYGG